MVFVAQPPPAQHNNPLVAGIVTSGSVRGGATELGNTQAHPMQPPGCVPDSTGPGGEDSPITSLARKPSKDFTSMLDKHLQGAQGGQGGSVGFPAPAMQTAAGADKPSKGGKAAKKEKKHKKEKKSQPEPGSAPDPFAIDNISSPVSPMRQGAWQQDGGSTLGFDDPRLIASSASINL